MKITRMIIGIISIVCFVIITFQSCAAGFVNAIEDNGGADGTAGFFLATCMLIAGIVGIAARKSRSGAITAGCFYLLGALVAIPNIGIFGDLAVWAFLCITFSAILVIGGILQKKKPNKIEEGKES